MTLDERVEQLERKIAQLEKLVTSKPKPQSAASSGKICKKCQQYSMHFVSSVPNKFFGEMGQTDDTYQCKNCSFEQIFQEQN